TVSRSVWPSFFFFSSRRRHTRSKRDWSSDVCSSDLGAAQCPHQVGGAVGVVGCTQQQFVHWGHGTNMGSVAAWEILVGCFQSPEIGRASCRERVGSAGGGEVGGRRQRERRGRRRGGE